MFTLDHQIEHLETLTRDFSNEIAAMDDSTVGLSLSDYIHRRHQLNTLRNLKAIAENELQALLHEYVIVFFGKRASRRPGMEKRVSFRLHTRIDAGLKKRVQVCEDNPKLKTITELAKEQFGGMFVEGKFRILSIRQIR